MLALATIGSSWAADWPTLQFIERGVAPYGSGYLTGAAPAGDGSGRMFVATTKGKILVWRNNEFLPVPFLDLTSIVPNYSHEGGVTDICPAPDFASSGTFYVSYTRGSDGHGVVARYRVRADDPNLADSASGEILLVIPRSRDLHIGGDLEFGEDGFLYISSGDDVNADASQSLSVLLGKILRIDVTSAPPAGASYVIPADNPYVGGAGGARGEIWAYGLRNPWRMSFDYQTGDLIIADVGDNNREEINRIPSGGSGLNFGWPILEGTMPRNVPPGFNLSTLTAPWFEYDRSSGTSVIGGLTLRGGTNRLNGLYWFADHGSKKVRAIDPSTANPAAITLGTLALPPSGFVRGENGGLYILSDGRIYEVVDTRNAQPPELTTSAPFPQTGPVEVTLGTITPGGVIRYTLDGTEPNDSSAAAVAGAPFVIDGISLLRAKVYREDLFPSTTMTWSFYFRVARPLISVAGFQGPDHAVLTAATTTPEAVLRYTTDGTLPTTTSGRFGEAIHFDPSGVLRVVGFKPGYADSEEAVGSDGGFEDSLVTTLAGGGVSGTADGPLGAARFSYPRDAVWTPDNRLYIADTGNHRIRCANLDSGMVTTIAGSIQGFADGTGSAARFNSPESITYDPLGDFLYVADTGNKRIRRVSRSGAVTTITTTSREPTDIAWNHHLGKLAWSEWASMWQLDAAGLPVPFAGSGAASAGQLGGHVRLVDDGAGDWFALNSSLKKVSGADGLVSTWISEKVSAYSLGTLDGPRSLARVYADPTNGIARDGLGNLYYTVGQSVRKLIRGHWQVTLAGESHTQGLADGPGNIARFYKPSGIAVDGNGRVFVADAWNHVIRRIVQKDWDSDLIADVDETLSGFLAVGDDDSRIDSDGDGFSDAVEFLSGTDPFGINSRISLELSMGSGVVELGWAGAAGLHYLIERSDDMTDWEADGPPVIGADGDQKVAKPLGSRGFYRLAPIIPASFSN